MPKLTNTTPELRHHMTFAMSEKQYQEMLIASNATMVTPSVFIRQSIAEKIGRLVTNLSLENLSLENLSLEILENDN